MRVQLALSFLAGGGEMGARLRAFDWAATPLGPAAQWPASLRTVVRLMLTTNHPVFVFWGAEHICLYNDAYSRSLGPEKHPSILGCTGQDAWPEIWADIGPQIDHVMAGLGATWHENQLLAIHRHGRLDPVYWTYSYGPIDDEQAPAGVGGVLVLCTETTAQVLAQQTLQAAEARWKLLFSQTPGFVCVLDGPAHRFEFTNPRYLELIGAADVIGKTVQEVLPETEAQGFIALLDWVYQTGQAYLGTAVPFRLEHAASGGSRLHHVDFVYQPIRDAAGRVTGIFVEGSDVTERVQATRALIDSEARYRALAEHLPGGAVFVVDHELRYVTAAGEALKALGFAPQELVGRTLQEVLGPDVAATYEPHYHRALAGEAFELEHAAHGRFYLTRGVPLFSATGAVYGVLAASYDITARRAVEEQLRAATARLDGVMAAAEVAMEQSLKASDRQKDEFLVQLAHELRNPLAPLLNATRILAAPSLGQRELAWCREVIQRQVQQMAMLLDELMDFSRSKQGQVLRSNLPRAPAVPMLPAPDTRPRRILIADDNADSAQSLSMLLELNGHITCVVADGRQALAAHASFAPDVGLLDIGMPGLNGYEVAQHIRRQPLGSQVLLAALTGWGQQEDKRKARAAGFDLHFTKPIDIDDLLNALGTAEAETSF